MLKSSKYTDYFIKDKTDEKFPNGKYVCQVKVNGKICGESIANTGNTSGRSLHLKAKHQDVYNKIVPAEKPEVPSIKDAFLGKNPYDRESARSQKLDDAVLNYIVNSSQPISVVDDKDFIEMLSAFDNRYKLKCRQTLTKTDIPKKLELIKTKLKNVIFIFNQFIKF